MKSSFGSISNQIIENKNAEKENRLHENNTDEYIIP